MPWSSSNRNPLRRCQCSLLASSGLCEQDQRSAGRGQLTSPRRSGGGRLWAVGCSVAAVVAAMPGVAHAADNLPPKQPLVADLMTETKACATGEGRAYV